ncbi:hypothetical protein CPS_4892 [Colwellia psychrerythraea 34H]|uniref:Uncharacterized protein n=1 Tax=Colwellia psychrerythraea (strain 34H / ATCC BAA-681) TaxID=167879 RepID=Q47UJ2_COLP3|nr:hypothetical protein CPS_4892 [Colwellia psychrerythraea 34H]
MGISEQFMNLVASVFKGMTINKKMRLAHELLTILNEHFEVAWV